MFEQIMPLAQGMEKRLFAALGTEQTAALKAALDKLLERARAMGAEGR